MKEENSELTLSIIKPSEAKGSIRIYKIQWRKPCMGKGLILYTSDNLVHPFHPLPQGN